MSQGVRTLLTLLALCCLWPVSAATQSQQQSANTSSPADISHTVDSNIDDAILRGPRNAEQTLDVLGAAVFDNQNDALSRVFNADKFIARVLNHLDFDDVFESELKQVLLEAVPDMLGSLVGAFQECRLTLTRLREGTRQADAVLRCDLDSTMQFYEFLFEKNLKDQFEIVDWFNYDAAALRSMTVAQLTAAGSGDVHTLNRLMGVRGQVKFDLLVLDLLDYDPQVTPYKEFERIYQHLPLDIRESRALMVYRSSMAYNSDDENHYRLALKELNERYGHDPRLAFALIDHYYYEKDYLMLHNIIDRYTDEFEGDAGLLTLKATLYIEEGKLEEAIKTAGFATEIEPLYPDAYMTLMTIYMKQRDHVRTLGVIKSMEHHFNVVYTAADFSNDTADSEAFAASSEFQEYLQKRKKSGEVSATP